MLVRFIVVLSVTDWCNQSDTSSFLMPRSLRMQIKLSVLVLVLVNLYLLKKVSVKISGVAEPHKK